MEQRAQFYIDGLWLAPVGTGSIEVFSPTDGALLATIPQGNAADADKAVMAARRAFDAWSITPAAECAAYLKKIQEGLTSVCTHLPID